jgi:hypothetical protein
MPMTETDKKVRTIVLSYSVSVIDKSVNYRFL